MTWYRGGILFEDISITSFLYPWTLNYPLVFLIKRTILALVMISTDCQS